MTDAPTISDIIDAVAEVTGVPRTDIMSTDRHPRVAIPRQIAMFLARESGSYSFPAIARAMGRNHSTVIHGIRKVEGSAEEPGMKPILAAARKRIATTKRTRRASA